MVERTKKRRWRRCPDCGRAVVFDGRPSKATLHGCLIRECEYPRCGVKWSLDRMVRLASGEWHCPNHGMMLAVKHLVSLYDPDHGADWVAMSAIIGRELPDLIVKAEMQTERALTG